ncbi:MAG: tetratricopeptide repeat protein [Alphaproteobacteria bacterium]|nr:tetratricopeptide repeat protein [Alphaproteobacteria bacterium]
MPVPAKAAAPTKSPTAQDHENLAKLAKSSAAAAFLLISQAVRQSDFSLARQILIEGLATFPNDTQLQKQALLVFLAAGDFARTVTAAKDDAMDEASAILANLVLTNHALLSGDLPTATRILTESNRKLQGDALFPVLLAHIVASDPNAQKSPQKIYALLDGIKARPNYRLYYHYHILLLAEQLGDEAQLTSAFDNLTAATTTKDGQEATLSLSLARVIGRVLEKQQRFDEAAKIYRQTSLSLTEPRILAADITRVTAAQNNPSDTAPARPTLNDLVALTYQDTANLMQREGEDNTLYKLLMFRLIEHVTPQSPENINYLAETLAVLQQDEDAILLYQRAASDPIWGWHVRLNRAILLDRIGNHEAATTEFEKLARERKDRSDAWQQLADLANRDHKYAAAVTYYTQALAQMADNAPQRWYLLYQRAAIYQELARYADVETDLKSALKLSPNHPHLLNFLGFMWAERGVNLDEALDLLTEAHLTLPNDAAITDSIGWVHYMRGNYSEAVTLLERAVSIQAEDPQINDHLGDAYWRVGRKREAIYQWQQALTLDPDAKYIAKIQAKLRDGLPKNAQND